MGNSREDLKNTTVLNLQPDETGEQEISNRNNFTHVTCVNKHHTLP